MRIVCATHQDLPEMIKAGSFREDLYYRLAEMVVRIPSLAERHGDAALLAKHFLHIFARGDEPARQGLRPRRAGGHRRAGRGRATCASSKTA